MESRQREADLSELLEKPEPWKQPDLQTEAARASCPALTSEDGVVPSLPRRAQAGIPVPDGTWTPGAQTSAPACSLPSSSSAPPWHNRVGSPASPPAREEFHRRRLSPSPYALERQ